MIYKATFTPSAHVKRQSLPVWPPTLNNYLYLFYLLQNFASDLGQRGLNYDLSKFSDDSTPFLTLKDHN